MINVGDKVVANYGAMFPTVEGEVTKCGVSVVHIMFDDGAVRMVDYDDIKMLGERSVNGSPIGIHLVA